MPSVQTWVDVDPDDFDDDELIEEFFRRARNKDFKERVKKEYPLEYADFEMEAPEPLPDHLSIAEEYYNRQQYEEVLIHLERALGWSGLSSMRLVK